MKDFDKIIQYAEQINHVTRLENAIRKRLKTIYAIDWDDLSSWPYEIPIYDRLLFLMVKKYYEIKI